MLTQLARGGLVRGNTIGIDGSDLEANAALRTLVRREDGMSYQDYLVELAKAEGIEEPTREDLARLDRKRPKKGSNKLWVNPHEPDAQITKMKDGSTDMGHKVEHAVDMHEGAVLGVTLRGGTTHDTKSVDATLEAAQANLSEVRETLEAERNDDDDDDEPGSPAVEVAERIEEAVMDKGYHSNQKLCDLDEDGIRTYIAEPKRGRRNWKGKQVEKKLVYANRRRVKGRRGRRLMRQRGELLERPFAHMYGPTSMGRTHLRRHDNILKRVLIHNAGYNLGLLMRKTVGVGTPRSLQGRLAAFFSLLVVLLDQVCACFSARVAARPDFDRGFAVRRRQVWGPNITSTLSPEPLCTPGC